MVNISSLHAAYRYITIKHSKTTIIRFFTPNQQWRYGRFPINKMMTAKWKVHKNDNQYLYLPVKAWKEFIKESLNDHWKMKIEILMAYEISALSIYIIVWARSSWYIIIQECFCMPSIWACDRRPDIAMFQCNVISTNQEIFVIPTWATNRNMVLR